MCAPSDSPPECSRPPPVTATRRPLTGRLRARAGPRLGRTDRGEGRPESAAVTTATCEHVSHSERPRALLRRCSCYSCSLYWHGSASARRPWSRSIDLRRHFQQGRDRSSRVLS
eukprot:SAG25_NODE_122_length_14632_cov_129.472098_13_plen_114_part_00